METKKESENALKQALERRQTGSLSSNFSFRMMEQIRKEAALRQKRKEGILFISLIVTVVTVVALIARYFICDIDIRFSTITMPSIELSQVSSSLMGFYCYIGVLVFILLGLDYWWRRKRLT